MLPGESKFLAVNRQELMVFDLTGKKVVSTGKNVHNLRHFRTITANSFIGWNFLSQAFLYKDISSFLDKPLLL